VFPKQVKAGMSGRQTITQSLVNNLHPTGKEFYVRDDRLSGFAVRVQPKGPITFVVSGRIKGGRACKVALGKPDLLTVAQAREAAEEPLRLMRRGIDPHSYRQQEAAEKRKAKAKEEALLIPLARLFERFMETGERKPSTVRYYNWVMESLLSDWSNKPVRMITRSEIEAKFVSIKKAKGQSTAVKFKRVMSALCNFAMEEEIDGELLLTSNPVKVLSGKRYDLRIPSKERFLDDEEIHKLLHYAYVERTWPTKELFVQHNKDGVSDQGLHFVLLALFTGLRRGEAERLRWEDVDFRKRLFVARDTKNGRDHVVPMSFVVSRLLEDQKQIAGNNEWVFPSPNSENGHISEPRSQLDRLKKATGIHDFSFHDLRRTFAHHAGRHGSDFFLIKKSLNHRSGDITAAYIGGTVEMIRPVFEAISRGYLSYFDPDLAREIYEPEAVAREAAEEYEDMKELGIGSEASF
jgi:integrase